MKSSLSTGNPKPNLNFLFSFGPHEKMADFQKAKAAAERFAPHVYVTEGKNAPKANLKEEMRETYEFLKAARESPAGGRELEKVTQEMDFAGFNGSEARYISEKGLYYYLLEASDDWRIPAYEQQANARKLESYGLLTHGRLDDAVEVFRLALGHEAQWCHARERVMVSNMADFGDQMREVYPQLESTTPIRVFVRLGQVHTSVYRMAKQEYAHRADMTIERIMDGHPNHPYDTMGRMQRATMFGKPVAREQILRFFSEVVLGRMVGYDGSEEASARMAAMRGVADRLSAAQMERVFFEKWVEGFHHIAVGLGQKSAGRFSLNLSWTKECKEDEMVHPRAPSHLPRPHRRG